MTIRLDGTRVLLVEDHDGSRKAMCQLLDRAGCIVSAAGSLAEALPQLAAPRDALLLDRLMPDGDGVSLIEPARRCHPASPIAIITGSGEADVPVTAASLGADALFVKPIDFELLLRWLSEQRAAHFATAL
jgi:two-component system, OmpR family, response regulator